MSTAVRLLSVFLIVGVLSGPVLVSAQATPAAVPSDQACKSVEPIGLLDLFNLVDDLDKVSNSGQSLTVTTSESPVTTGPEISSAEREQIKSTLDALISCVNLRDPLRIVALLSQRFQALLVMDLISGADAMSVVAKQIPVIVDSPERTDPLPSPTIERAWRESQDAANIEAIVSLPIPGYENDVKFLIVLVPGPENTWQIDEIARYKG